MNGGAPAGAAGAGQLDRTASLTVSQRWNRALLSTRRDTPGSAPPRRRYAIVSVPRSGSTLLCRAFEATGELGVPHEYFNPNAFAAWKTLQGRAGTPLDIYLSEMEPRRTSASGWFGVKVHFRHFKAHYGEEARARAAAFLQRQDTLILCYRRDQVAQAVSYYRARRTGRWTSEHVDLDPTEAPVPPFDVDALCECLEEIQSGESAWRALLQASGKPWLAVACEALQADYTGSVRPLLDGLGLPDTPVPAAPTRRLARSASDDLEPRFRAWLEARRRAEAPGVMARVRRGFKRALAGLAP